ncbi:DUF7452 domain-containing protein [Petrachloros mirabilis]
MACGGAYQRMQVGILPDIFLNHTEEVVAGPSTGRVPRPRNPVETILYPFRWIWRQVLILFGWSWTIREKIFNHYWTGNLNLPGIGDCNVYARVTIEGVGTAVTYGPCSSNVRACELKWMPESAAVGPAISDLVVKEWVMRLVAESGIRSETIGGVRLYGLDCQGDICVPPDCLQENRSSEFYEGPDPRCLDYDAAYEGWQSTGPGIGPAYLLGRGNLYIGPRDQPAFVVTAGSDTDGVQIDHWIANGNPAAIILVTPRGDQGRSSGFYGVIYDTITARWSIIPEIEGELIVAGNQFNVYVMGGRGPGFRVRTSGGDIIWLDDELLNNNPNALVFATHAVSEICEEPRRPDTTEGGGPVPIMPGERAGGGWECRLNYFPHPIGVRYDGRRQRWALVSEDGTLFPPHTAYNVVVAGLAGSYRQDVWIPGATPAYAGRLESSHASPIGNRMTLAQLDAADENSLVFIMHNLTPYDEPALAGSLNLSPVGVTLQADSWQAITLDSEEMAEVAFNALIPLPAP